MTAPLYSFGKDVFWLEAVTRAAGPEIDVEAIHCAGSLADCVVSAPTADVNALVLVDASLEPNPATVVKVLRQRGWRYVVVVAADPSWREAHDVLHDAGGYDYWKKTYNVQAIGADVRRCLQELAGPGTGRDRSN